MNLTVHDNYSSKKLSLCLPLVLIAGLGFHATAQAEKTWSERKFERTVLSIDWDLNRKRWNRVIERSQEALPHCIALYSERNLTCLFMLRNINQSYVKQRKFNPNRQQIEHAYRLSTEVLGRTHFTTTNARDYYYKYLIFTENYAPAIPIVKEIIELEVNSSNDAYQLMERYKQLYALEGLSENWPAEEAALQMVVKLARDVLGRESEDFRAAVEALAQNYCTQKKYYEYFQLIEQEQQEVPCFSRPNG